MTLHKTNNPTVAMVGDTTIVVIKRAAFCPGIIAMTAKIATERV